MYMGDVNAGSNGRKHKSLSGIYQSLKSQNVAKAFPHHGRCVEQQIICRHSMQPILFFPQTNGAFPLLYIGVIQEEIDESLMKFNLTRRR